jgi:hypothetical protein
MANTRRRVVGCTGWKKAANAVAIIAGIIVARHLDTADDLFGGPQGSPRTDKMIAASIQWADRILKKSADVVLGLTKGSG